MLITGWNTHSLTHTDTLTYESEGNWNNYTIKGKVDLDETKGRKIKRNVEIINDSDEWTKSVGNKSHNFNSSNSNNAIITTTFNRTTTPT